MDFAFHLPINSVSFGQVSTALLREVFRRGSSPPLFLIGEKLELDSQKEDQGFAEWLNEGLTRGALEYRRQTPVLKLWHIQDSLASVSEKQVLLTFYELDEPTKLELNILRNQAKVLVTSEYTSGLLNSQGVNASTIPLGFDKDNFNSTGKEYAPDDRITFTLAGKFEKRKHHEKILDIWAKKYGNNKKYFLNCALYNSFLSPEQNNGVIARALQGKQYFNINFLGFMGKNELYNDFLNAGDVIIGMSGGEGWGLPEFHSVALGKHSVILNANAYKEWATEENSVLVEPSAKIPAYDGMFFREGAHLNQGNIFDFTPEAFISGCEEAIKRVESNRVNEAGLKLQEEFTVARSLDSIIKHLEEVG